MGLKSISIVLFGLALCCFLQGATAQEDACLLKLASSTTYPKLGVWTWSRGGRFASPFQGWNDNYSVNISSSLYSMLRVQKASSFCDYCTMKVYTNEDFTREIQTIDFRTKVGDNSEITLKSYSYSYILECFPPQPEEEEEVEHEEAEEESGEEVEYEEEEEDRSGDFPDAEFQQMNEGDGETIAHWLVELRHRTSETAINKLVSKGTLSAGKYTVEKIYSTEFSTNYESLYRFNVQVRDESGVEYRIWFTVYSAFGDLERYWLVNAGYKENRLGEFPHTDWKVIPFDDETQQPYPIEVEDLGNRAFNQAVGRLQDKGILPKGTYTLFIYYYNYNVIEHSAIVNMTEYPDHDDILYRFIARAVDQSGTLFRVWSVIATNYETPEYYELIDYGYKQSRLAEWGDIDMDWREMNEVSDEIVQMRSRSIPQAIPRLQAEGTLPAGTYTIAKTYATEWTVVPPNPNYQFLTVNEDDSFYRFNVQVSNEAGARFRIAVTVATGGNIEPKYELIDYTLVENRLDEFTNTNFRSLNEGDIQTQSINQAVDHLIAKNTLPEGQYTISKTFPTEFSANFEHPDYSTDDYILYKFTAQVKNAAKAEYKVYAIVISAYDAPQDFELIDYGKVDA